MSTNFLKRDGRKPLRMINVGSIHTNISQRKEHCKLNFSFVRLWKLLYNCQPFFIDRKYRARGETLAWEKGIWCTGKMEKEINQNSLRWGCFNINSFLFFFQNFSFYFNSFEQIIHWSDKYGKCKVVDTKQVHSFCQTNFYLNVII